MGIVRPVTGRGITTEVAMESADLGIVRWDSRRNANAVLFGDNFEFWRMQGEWRSPSIVMYDRDYKLLGVPAVVGGEQLVQKGRVKQLWPYEHNNAEFSTVLPTDFIKVGEWWYIYVMVTKGLGNERWTGWRRSRDLVSWELIKTFEVSQIHQGQVMLTFDRFDSDIYIFGTGGLRRNKPIWAWKCDVSEFPLGHWEQLNSGNPVLHGSYGELCLRAVQGNAVLSFFDAGGYRQTARTLPSPEQDWNTANSVDYAHGNSLPQLYGGYITPQSKLNEPNGMKFLVSQWNTSTNDPYHVLLVEDVLHAQGPLIESSEVEEEEVVEVEGEKPVTAPPESESSEIEELISVLVKELSRTGSKAILDTKGKKRTLREALEAVHWKEITQLRLSDRPRPPSQEDDQLGHVLSSRVEGLMTLALLDELVKKLKLEINTSEIYRRVRESLK